MDATRAEKTHVGAVTDDSETTLPLVVIGDYVWDVMIRGNTELLSGGDIFGEVQLAPGGSAANSAVWARRCGLPTTFVGKIGQDRFGVLAQEDLAREGIEAVWLHSDAHLTGSVAVWIDHTGQRSMVSGKGADHYLLPSELPLRLLGRARHLHMSAWSFFGDPPRAAVRRAAAVVKGAGGTVSLDPGSFQMIQDIGVDTFLSYTADLGVDLLLPNAEEGRVLSGGETEPERIAARLAEIYPGALIALKLDADGAYVLENGTGTLCAPAPGRLVDATGAGDAFAGAFLADWLRGASPEKAAVWANRVSAWVIQRVGARPPGDGALTRLLGGSRTA
ncbi:MAG: carbohydrate kinase family protein [Trueperaceae bacterium]|nr:carbohydrate kinase family protein [Trueperaceae bacterium]